MTDRRDTPRTDELYLNVQQHPSVEFAFDKMHDHALQLERELTAAQAELAALQHKLDIAEMETAIVQDHWRAANGALGKAASELAQAEHVHTIECRAKGCNISSWQEDLRPPADPLAQGVVRDAARYRWLRANCRVTAEARGGCPEHAALVYYYGLKTPNDRDSYYAAGLDAAIDAALAAAPDSKPTDGGKKP
jgi:hypothetical protein